MDDSFWQGLFSGAMIVYHIFEHIVLWAGLVYVDHLAVHHSLIHATFGSSQNSLKLSQTNLIGRNPF